LITTRLVFREIHQPCQTFSLSFPLLFSHPRFSPSLSLFHSPSPFPSLHSHCSLHLVVTFPSPLHFRRLFFALVHFFAPVSPLASSATPSAQQHFYHSHCFLYVSLPLLSFQPVKLARWNLLPPSSSTPQLASPRTSNDESYVSIKLESGNPVETPGDEPETVIFSLSATTHHDPSLPAKKNGSSSSTDSRRIEY
jgi:hypothetical protein